MGQGLAIAKSRSSRPARTCLRDSTQEAAPTLPVVPKCVETAAGMTDVNQSTRTQSHPQTLSANPVRCTLSASEDQTHPKATAAQDAALPSRVAGLLLSNVRMQ